MYLLSIITVLFKVQMYSDKEVYGQIEYFFVHSYSGNQRMLAFIQWISEVYIDKYEAKRFQGFSNYDFIEVKYIDRCVGFMKIRDTFYIFDKENQVNYE